MKVRKKDFMKNQLTIGVDTGNRCMKTKNFTFDSGLKKESSKPLLDIEFVKYNGDYYTLTNKRIPYMEDKTETDGYFILTLFAIAKEIVHRNIDCSAAITITLAVGLPPAHIGRLKNSFTQYFKRDYIRFEYNDRMIVVKIEDVLLFPQGYAAILPYFQEVAKAPKAYIVDIGGYTTDVILLRNGEIDMSFCESFDLGVIEFFNELNMKLKRDFGRIPDEKQIESAIIQKHKFFKNMTERINEEAEIYTKNLLRKLNELGVDLVLSKGLFIGGGSLLFHHFIEASDYVFEPYFIKNVSANAEGYEYLANLR